VFQTVPPDPHPMMQAFNVDTPEKYVQLVLRKVKSRYSIGGFCLLLVKSKMKENILILKNLP